jgi:hypothetical protein
METDKKASGKLFPELRKKLLKNLDPMEVKIFEYFDFPKWAESKIERKPFMEMLGGNSG